MLSDAPVQQVKRVEVGREAQVALAVGDVPRSSLLRIVGVGRV